MNGAYSHHRRPTNSNSPPRRCRNHSRTTFPQDGIPWAIESMVTSKHDTVSQIALFVRRNVGPTSGVIDSYTIACKYVRRALFVNLSCVLFTDGIKILDRLQRCCVECGRVRPSIYTTSPRSHCAPAYAAAMSLPVGLLNKNLGAPLMGGFVATLCVHNASLSLISSI